MYKTNICNNIKSNHKRFKQLRQKLLHAYKIIYNPHLIITG